MPDPSLSADRECHIWALPPEEDHVEQLRRESWGLLCKTEQQRHQAMRNPLVARRFLLGRCLLRRGLAVHLDVKPEELRFGLQGKGKPALTYPAAEGWSFNLSHSGQESVVAIAHCNAIGIDIEALSRGANVMRIAERFFSSAERRQIASWPEGPDNAALKLWVIKESITKALGESIWDALTGVQPNITGRNLGWLRPPPCGSEDNWALVLGPFRRRYVLALALHSPNGWSDKTILFRNHVLGQGETESLPFCPKMKTKNPITRPADV